MAVKSMIDSLESEFYRNKLKVSDLNFNSASDMLNSIDDILLDGGEFICERFTDLAHEFAFDFGDMESEEFEDAKWKCIELAYSVLKKKYEKEYLVNSLSNEEILALVEEKCILEGKVKVEPHAVAFTDVPIKLSHFAKQRSRWARGMIEGLREVKP